MRNSLVCKEKLAKKIYIMGVFFYSDWYDLFGKRSLAVFSRDGAKPLVPRSPEVYTIVCVFIPIFFFFYTNLVVVIDDEK